MRIPNSESAVIPASKLTGYLLDLSHPVGGTKARYFRAHGYNESNVGALARGLREIASGDLKTPRGTVVRIETVWIIETGSNQPRIVTEYPV